MIIAKGGITTDDMKDLNPMPKRLKSCSQKT